MENKLDMNFDYTDFTLEEIDTYNCYNFVCDGDSKTITAVINEEEE